MHLGRHLSDCRLQLSWLLLLRVADVKELLTILQHHFPERLEQALLVNVPALFYAAWKVLSPFVNEKTQSKVVFVDDAQKDTILRRYMSDDIRPTRYGGQFDNVPVPNIPSVIEAAPRPYPQQEPWTLVSEFGELQSESEPEPETQPQPESDLNSVPKSESPATVQPETKVQQPLLVAAMQGCCRPGSVEQPPQLAKQGCSDAEEEE
jgi:hypothetical protein